ncbi:MAG TPA: hypothetical protein VFT19_08100 [Solirubrobacterales bacterium]|nr:hypothetical protein [Solirubrobacterales bacterium]
MRQGSKTLIAAIAVLLVALGLAACGGGDDDSGSTTAADAGSQGQAEGGDSKQGNAGKSGEGKSGSGDGRGDSNGSGSGNGQSGGSGSDASDFTPKQHNDSGGGAQQFRQKGGDNSVQEFGEEADDEEFDAAAVALHNFLDARAEGNWAAACDYMSKAIVESFEKLAAQAKQIKDTTCAGILEKLTNPAAKQSMKAEAEKANVGSLRVEGDRSFVIYTGIGGTILAMPMANEDGDWKVASLAGTPLN